MKIVTPCQTPAQIEAGCQLLEQMYPAQSPAKIREIIGSMLSAERWQMVGIFNAEIPMQCDAVILYLIGHRLFCGKFLQPESLFIRPEVRRGGHAAALFDWLEEKAKAEGCDRVLLESLVENFTSHKFFFKRGYHIRGYVVNLLLNDDYSS